MSNRATCVDCGAFAPATNSDHTLTSTLGWRLTRGKRRDGSLSADWRCPVCWGKRKTQTQRPRE